MSKTNKGCIFSALLCCMYLNMKSNTWTTVLFLCMDTTYRPLQNLLKGNLFFVY